MGAELREVRHTVPGAYAIHLLDIIARWGVDEPRFLAEFGLRREELTDPSCAMPLDVAVPMYERAVEVTGEPALGVYLGLQMRATAHGILGFAVICAKSLRDSIRLAAKYISIRTTALSLQNQEVDGVGTLVLTENADLGGAREGYAFAVLLGFWSMGRIALGRAFDVQLDFAFPRPAYYDRFEAALPPARFDQPQHQILLKDLSLLEAPLAMSDATSLRMAKDQCEQILQSMGLDGRLVPRVRSVLSRDPGDVKSLKTVARNLRLSPRTFRRHLESEGVTFSELADEERRRRALLLLRSNELSVREVGDRLGYSDVANFTRAFRRWTGKTPSAYRQDR
jgi:AraC-like DNA-binding protein